MKPKAMLIVALVAIMASILVGIISGRAMKDCQAEGRSWSYCAALIYR